MCYAYGSLEQATGVCPMCKVFKPIGGATRCPHVKDVCRNRALHPRHDVVYLKNAEVSTFAGCGFCKWANAKPPLNQSGYQNPGWPGCCRPPKPEDYKYIGAADWPTVSVVHHIPIPADVKAILDSITNGRSGSGSPMGTLRITNGQSTPPSIMRRATFQAPARTEGHARSSTVSIPARGRSNGSPQQATAALSGVASRNASGNSDGTASSLPNRSAMDHFQAVRRVNTDQPHDRRSESTNAEKHSPGHRSVDLGGSLSRRNTERRPTISAAMPSMSISKVTVDAQPPRRRAQTSSTSSNSPPSSVTATRTAERQNTALPPPQRRVGTLEKSLGSMNISSASSSSSGSNSESTVISDGGFTDYLSDESEAELQRQAEVKAAMLAQSHLEEQEFRAARQQLASVDLRPPKSWNPSSIPRSHASASHTPSYAQSSPFTAVYPTGSLAGSAHPRG
ncbi:uncharacterized protein LAESUDRAFT_719119 [Laetiporus sulphureus 93-53]|uniref:Uncharacterized protein n=1 Tax=Laetiporus sulphureus 93-53 TaxID=1314785 RepID=A0A165IAP1_9APHY|nr:uncharacterized protein LAESUDRAFT_719119 [Laetiporus sulphureus 93-53]KZT12814.1 hypothetical protein LAESUDRAFT_719119 [Laetiporus sulphureus 93-53]